MGARGPKLAASPTAISMGDISALKRTDPPRELTSDQANVWREVVEDLSVEALVGFRGAGLGHTTKAATSAPSRALPRRRALCTYWKKPRSSGSLSCERPRCGRSQE